MKSRIGKDLEPEFTRHFVPVDADLSDPFQVKSLCKILDAEKVFSATELEDWLLKWSELATALAGEEETLYLLKVSRTDDKDREREYLDFLENVLPKLKPRRQRLVEKFLASTHVKDLNKERYEVIIRDFKSEVRLFNE
jgi:oligoendopeptidase F